jgi:hypothetical protein
VRRPQEGKQFLLVIVRDRVVTGGEIYVGFAHLVNQLFNADAQDFCQL